MIVIFRALLNDYIRKMCLFSITFPHELAQLTTCLICAYLTHQLTDDFLRSQLENTSLKQIFLTSTAIRQLLFRCRILNYILINIVTIIIIIISSSSISDGNLMG